MSARVFTLTPGGQAQFRFPYDEELTATIRDALKVHWNGTQRAWCIRVMPANIRTISTLVREHDFDGAELAEQAQANLFARCKEAMRASRAADADFVPPATLRGTLRPFQKAGVAYAVAECQKGKGILFGDQPGLGKTVQTIATLEALESFPAVVICPASLIYNWQLECRDWIRHRTTCVIEPGEVPHAADIVIASYEMLSKWNDWLKALEPKAVAFDEGHLLKCHKTKRSASAKKLRDGVPVRMILTGTPVVKSPKDLINPLSIIGRLEDVGGFDFFVSRYCDAKEVDIPSRAPRRGMKPVRKRLDINGASNLDELARRLRATCMVRRYKRDVLPELPEKQHSFLPVQLSNRAEYDMAQKDVLKWVAQKAGRDPEFRATIQGLTPERQIAAVLARAQDAVDRAAQAEELVKIETLKQICAKGKLDAATEWIDNFLATGEKLLVFAWHQEALNALAERIVKAGHAAPALITGDTSSRKREEIKQSFQKESVIQTVLLNHLAGGVGLTLTAASNVLVLEWPWNPSQLDQSIDRAHRIGQRNAVNAWFMVGRNTIDRDIWLMLERKRKITEAATR